jgi:hypothetical protein
MIVMGIYNEWGFTANPFTQTALDPDEFGEELLVGRDELLSRVKMVLSSPPRVPTLDGINGVGKTSLANIACYQLYQDFVDAKNPILFLPCRKRFQLSASKSSEDIINEVFLAIAETIIEFKISVIDQTGNLPHLKAMQSWVSSPTAKSVQGGLSLFQVGISVGGGATPNTSEGFSKVGFRTLIRAWIAELFSAGDEGGIVCVFDNLELLETSVSLRKCVEELRDELFTAPGIRPVLCGANGMVLTTLSSPRLSGLLHKPVVVGPLSLRYAYEVFSSRIKAFSITENDCYLPLNQEVFHELYDAVGKNLRELLHFSDEYCMDVAMSGDHPMLEQDKVDRFYIWLDKMAGEIYQSASSRIKARSWQLLGDLSAQGGTASPSDFDEFGFNSKEAMRPYAKELEDSNLILVTREESDKRRKNLLVSAQGYLAQFYQDKYVN